MFGQKKMYKKGLADAMHAYEDFGKKQEAALEYMREEVRSGNKKLEDALTSLGDDLNGIYKYLNSQEKAALYHLSTPMDLKELDAEDKRLLLAVLYQLAEDEGEKLTDDQRAYIRSIQKYMEVTNPQTFADFSAIENIDSIDVQKTFLRVSLEFLYLQDGDELSDGQEDFFDYFSVNKKQATVIENEVSRLFNVVGSQGIAEKYGYVPEEEAQVNNDDSFSPNNVIASSTHLSDAAVEEFLNGSNWCNTCCVETENYIIQLHPTNAPTDYSEQLNKLLRLDKRLGETKVFHFPYPYACFASQWIENAQGWQVARGDLAIFELEDHPNYSFYSVDVSNLDAPPVKLLELTTSWKVIQWSTYENLLVYCLGNGEVFAYDLQKKSHISLQIPHNHVSGCVADKDGFFYMNSNYNQNADTLYYYDLRCNNCQIVTQQCIPGEYLHKFGNKLAYKDFGEVGLSNQYRIWILDLENVKKGFTSLGWYKIFEWGILNC